MIFDWYKVINKAEFEATGLVSRELELVLEGLGLVTVMITRGQYFSIIYDGVMLSIGMTEANPFAFDGYAAYLDENNDVWLGIPTDES